jgi:hypothetical protein
LRLFFRPHAVGWLVLANVCLLSPPAHAYLDPGTGSALVYVITGIVVSLFFAARGLYYRLSELAFRRGHKHQKCTLAIHSEDPRYEITFLPVVRALCEDGVELSLFTMYERDGTFEVLPKGVTHHVIPPGLVGYTYLNHLEAQLLITTTPQLDVMMFRRSKAVKHYAHIQHALGESRYVRPYAYDYFDTILCCGPIFKANLRKMEAIRGSQAKQLLETGVPHYDDMLESALRPTAPHSRPLVLIAPSWGPLSLFECFGTNFVKSIAEQYDVVVRPHPQMRVSNASLYDEITNLEGVRVNTDRTPLAVLEEADILVSDISGIMHEFAFIYEKPVIIIDRKMHQGGLEGELLGGDSDLKERCRDIIIPIPPDEIDSIATHVESALKNFSKQRARELREELVYNFGNAGKVAAAQVKDLLQCLS